MIVKNLFSTTIKQTIADEVKKDLQHMTMLHPGDKGLFIKHQ